MSTPKKTAPRTRQPDAIALLKADHAEVKAMYKRYEELVDKKAAASNRRWI